MNLSSDNQATTGQHRTMLSLIINLLELKPDNCPDYFGNENIMTYRAMHITFLKKYFIQKRKPIIQILDKQSFESDFNTSYSGRKRKKVEIMATITT